MLTLFREGGMSREQLDVNSLGERISYSKPSLQALTTHTHTYIYTQLCVHEALSNIWCLTAHSEPIKQHHVTALICIKLSQVVTVLEAQASAKAGFFLFLFCLNTSSGCCFFFL